MTTAQFDDLKLLIKDYFTARDKHSSKPEVAINQRLLQLIQREREKDPEINMKEVM